MALQGLIRLPHGPLGPSSGLWPVVPFCSNLKRGTVKNGGKSMGYRVRSGTKSGACCFLAGWYWTNELTSLSAYFRGLVWDDIWKVLKKTQMIRLLKQTHENGSYPESSFTNNVNETSNRKVQGEQQVAQDSHSSPGPFVPLQILSCTD